VGEGAKEEKVILKPGMVQFYPTNVLHGMTVLEDIVIIEALAPVPKTSLTDSQVIIVNE